MENDDNVPVGAARAAVRQAGPKLAPYVETVGAKIAPLVESAAAKVKGAAAETFASVRGAGRSAAAESGAATRGIAEGAGATSAATRAAAREVLQEAGAGARNAFKQPKISNIAQFEGRLLGQAEANAVRAAPKPTGPTFAGKLLGAPLPPPPPPAPGGGYLAGLFSTFARAPASTARIAGRAAVRAAGRNQANAGKIIMKPKEVLRALKRNGQDLVQQLRTAISKKGDQGARIIEKFAGTRGLQFTRAVASVTWGYFVWLAWGDKIKDVFDVLIYGPHCGRLTTVLCLAALPAWADPFSHQSENVEVAAFGNRGHEQYMKEELRDREAEIAQHLKDKYAAFKSGLVSKVRQAKIKLDEIEETRRTDPDKAERMFADMEEEYAAKMPEFYANPTAAAPDEVDASYDTIMMELNVMDSEDGGLTDALVQLGGAAATSLKKLESETVVAVADLATDVSEVASEVADQAAEPVMKVLSQFGNKVQEACDKIAEYDLNKDAGEAGTWDEYKQFYSEKVQENLDKPGMGEVSARAVAAGEFGIAVAADCFGAYFGPNGDVCAKDETNPYYAEGDGE